MEIQILNLINQHLHGSEIVNHLAKFISIISDNGYIWLALGLFLMISIDLLMKSLISSKETSLERWK